MQAFEFACERVGIHSSLLSISLNLRVLILMRKKLKLNIQINLYIGSKDYTVSAQMFGRPDAFAPKFWLRYVLAPTFWRRYILAPRHFSVDII